MAYRVPLKVCSIKGARITAKINRVSEGSNIIELPYIEAVEKDNPVFAKKGKIRLTYVRSKHQEIIEKVTSYLENLFLKELDNNENNNTSKSSKSNSGRNKKRVDTSTAKKSKRKSINSLHNSGRGNEQAESNRGGVKDPELVKGSDSEGKE